MTQEASRPYRAPAVHEVRLNRVSNDLGFVYTGLEISGGFEDQVLAGAPRVGYTVHGHPAVISGVGGGLGRHPATGDRQSQRAE